MTRIISTTEKTDTQPSIGVDHVKPGSDHTVEVIGRVREDGSIEVLGYREPAEKGREAVK